MAHKRIEANPEPALFDINNIVDNTGGFGMRPELFIIDEPDATEITREAWVTDLGHRARLLDAALKDVAVYNSDIGFKKNIQTPHGAVDAAQRYGDSVEKIADFKKPVTRTLPPVLEKHFEQAYSFGLPEGEAVDKKEIDAELNRFLEQYGDTGRAAAAKRNKYRKQLQAVAKRATDAVIHGDQYRMSVVESAPVITPDFETPDVPRLMHEKPSVVARLKKFRSDQRAAFYPNTSTELYDGAAILKGQERLGFSRTMAVQNYFQNIAVKGGSEAITSKIHEFIDCVEEADRTVASLTTLQSVIAEYAEQGKGLTGLDVLLTDKPELMPAVRRVIRYLDHKRVAEEGVSTAPFSTMAVVRNENPSVLAAGQNKRLEDKYMSDDSVVTEYIARRVHDMHVRSIRLAVPEAIENANRQRHFGRETLRDIGGSFTAVKEAVFEARRNRR